MAVDTRNKRASVISLALAFKLLAPNPDGSLATLADREHCALCYAWGATSAGTQSPVRIRDLSAPRYAVVDASGPRYRVVDRSGPRYTVEA